MIRNIPAATHKQNEINWFKTPASSRDINPIELIWHAVKDYLRNEHKPKNLGELKMGYGL